MTRDDFEGIEQTLGIKLPEDYRNILINYPLSNSSDDCQCMLCNDPEWLISCNDLEPKLHSQPHHRKGRWPPSLPHFLIGDDGGEESYYLDLRRSPSPVYCFDLEVGELTQYADDLESYVRLCHRIDLEIEEDERQMAERAKERKWWQFWHG